MNVWVPGGRGMLGQAVCRALSAARVPYVASGHEVDISDASTAQAFAADHGFTHIINCAAYTKVDACESHADEAFSANASAPGHLAHAAARLGATAMHVSTDYVFDGAGAAPYKEDDACAPLGVYGRSKHDGEQRFLARLEGSTASGYVVRTSWLFGHGGANFVATMLRLMAERDSLSVVADQKGRPTFCDDLAAALLRLGGVTGPAGPAGVYHYANSGETTWHGFATQIAEEARGRGAPLACREVVPIATRDYPTPAKRPAYSVLCTDKVAAILGQEPRPWQLALRTYMDLWDKKL